MFNEVALEGWLTRDSCYLNGLNKKKSPRGSRRVGPLLAILYTTLF